MSTFKVLIKREDTNTENEMPRTSKSQADKTSVCYDDNSKSENLTVERIITLCTWQNLDYEHLETTEMTGTIIETAIQILSAMHLHIQIAKEHVQFRFGVQKSRVF